MNFNNNFTQETAEKYGIENINSIKAVICDRDGTINVSKPADPNNSLDSGYILNSSQWKFAEFAGEGLALFQKIGLDIHVFTQQSGIEKGCLTHSDLVIIHQHMRNKLRQNYSVEIGEITYCPHVKIDGIYSCLASADPCAKLEPEEAPRNYRGQLGMIINATDLKPHNILVIGDTMRDLPSKEFVEQGMMFIGVKNPANLANSGRLCTAGYLVSDDILQIAEAFQTIKR